MIKDEINIESIPGIENLGNNYYSNSDDPFIIEIKDTYPQNVPAKLIVSGNGFSDTFKIEIPISPMILFVDDHLGGGDGIDVPIKSYYDSTFRNLGVSYHYWLNSTSPDSETIKKYPIVVWGCEWAFPSLEKTDRDVLSYYLEQGGNLFISGQDIGWDLCDPSSENNQHYYSSGDSKTWYEKYLSSRYISDAGGINPLTPTDSSILDLSSLGSFEFLQPGRIENQYPSIIEPLDNAFAILKYDNNKTAAIASNRPYKVVYFAFGGFEAIKKQPVRMQVMQDIINHFNNLNVRKTILGNTESKGPFTVNCIIKSDQQITDVSLLYRINDSDWNVRNMTKLNDSTYSADIPEITQDSATIEYRTLIFQEDGTYNADIPHRFYSGPDTGPPSITPIAPLPEYTINKNGPFYIGLMLEDDIGIDTNNVKLYLTYFTEGQKIEKTVSLKYSNQSIWESTFYIDHTLQEGDSISYFVEVYDNSSNSNKSRFPETGYLTTKISNNVIIDNFEDNDLIGWYNPRGIWTIYSNPKFVQEGSNCLKTGKELFSYPANINAPIEYAHPFNLTGRENAKLRFLVESILEDDNDTCYVEISSDNETWRAIDKIYGKGLKKWELHEIDLSDYCSEDTDPIKLRFRFKTDDNEASVPGIFIDMVEILTDIVDIDTEQLKISKELYISDVYPNPTNSSICIDISGCRDKTLYINVYNLLGQNVFRKRLLLKTNNYKFTWDFKDSNSRRIPTGIYFIEVRTNNYRKLDKVLLLK
ncbi:MAG TPA: T9SS type A sorting domain-containing protein [Candidatus Marinimicrobia bacterium]|nr:T9SS type A sorting domain-containing protein [Candidatus Neomarinimicrobiota bacterium]